MKVWLLAILFAGAVFVDGVILSAVFAFKEGFLSMAFIVLLILYGRGSQRVFILGLIFSFLLEFHLGLDFGKLVLPFLISFGFLCLLNGLFYTRSKVFTVIFGILIFVCFWESAILISKMI